MSKDTINQFDEQAAEDNINQFDEQAAEKDNINQFDEPAIEKSKFFNKRTLIIGTLIGISVPVAFFWFLDYFDKNTVVSIRLSRTS